MTRKFQDVMLRRNELLHQRSIWQEVSEHLAKFLDTDSTSAKVGIKTDGGGLVVPQDRIELTLNEIKNGYMAEIHEELYTINKSEVTENAEQEPQGSKNKSKKSKGAGSGAGKAVKRKKAKSTRAGAKPNKR